MTQRSDPEEPVTFRIDGLKVKSVNDFYREIGRAVNGPGGYFGRNLDALADCLRGGFGTPENRPFQFDWDHSGFSRRHLPRVQPGRRPFFDEVLEVFDDVGVPLNLR